MTSSTSVRSMECEINEWMNEEDNKEDNEET